ncbi:pseudouridine synthase [Nonomuraea composti]|uniref:pseudouridine synthase n=1 Tax=Nonomuraea composti TaxID=2720023 RepID=UPI003204A45B
MINRRSTPSGDGRGRGRAAGSGRAGRPAFRSDDTRGGFRRDDDSRGGGPRRDERASRDSLRADRGGTRARYGGRRDGDNEGRSGRDDRFGGDRGSRFGGDRFGAGRGDRGDRFDGGRGERSDRGDRGGRDERASRYGRDDWSGGRGERDDRFGGRADRFGGGRGDRPAREERFGGRSDRPVRDDRFGRGERGPRGEERGGFRSDRRDDRRDDRRFESRDAGRASGRDDRGYASRDDRGYVSRDDRREDRAGGFRAGRSGRREEFAPRPAGSTRSRYGRRDGDDRQGGERRAPRRDGVQTIGGGPRRGGGSQSFGQGNGQGYGQRSGQGSRQGYGQGSAQGRSQGSAQGRGQGSGQSYGSPQERRVKAARQPLRDHAFYPEGYTDERDTTEVPGGVRLQKVLAQAGVASRRACEEMIGEGRVTVNGQVVRRFGAKVDPATQVIHVDGKRIPTAPDLVYYALNKPIGVVSTMDDPQGRPCLADYVEELAPRLFHVGRLDTETEGLLLLTNDGELANRLTHPSYGVQKKYWAKVPGPIPRDLGRRLKQGIELEDGIARADSFSIVQEHGQQALVEVVLHEGRKHVVRRMLEEAGHRVIDLARIEFGPVKLGRTKPGTVRALTLKEVGELYAAVKL